MPQPRYSPKATEVIQKEILTLVAAEVVRRSTSAWVIIYVLVPKKDVSGGLGDLPVVLDSMRGSWWFKSIDLTSGFTRLEIEGQTQDGVPRRVRGAFGAETKGVRYQDLADGLRCACWWDVGVP